MAKKQIWRDDEKPHAGYRLTASYLESYNEQVDN